MYLGIDFGTSGVRAIVIDNQDEIHWQIQSGFTPKEAESAESWKKSLFNLIEQIPRKISQEIQAIAINGTSATVLLCDACGNPIDRPILYNDGRSVAILEDLLAVAPSNSLVLSVTSSLAKLFWWYRQSIYQKARFFLHQADWLGFLLHGKLGISDYHNALKLGYDVEQLCYPNWIEKLPFFPLLPKVIAPGIPIGKITKKNSERYFLPENCLICAGTTDSIAAFLASGVKEPGSAVTSLGSTLVLKLLSTIKIEDIQSGIYSHRLGNLWLTGGSSNTGGAILKHFFNEQELITYSQQINPEVISNLDYYPLLKPGERFPINDPQLLPRLTPRPENSLEFLHGLLESLARIEALGYKKLQQLGASHLKQVYTAGGGAKNETWRIIREGCLQVPVKISPHTEAAYGSALLAKSNF